MEHQWVLDRCREVQAEPNGRLDLWARGHYKSSAITHGLTIQDILNNPELTFGIFSHTRPAAKSHLRVIKRELEINDLLKAMFPEILYQDPAKESPKWAEDEGIVVRRQGNPQEATVEAWGLVDGMPVGKHFTHRIYDDIVTEKSVTSPEMIEKTTRALELSYSLGSVGGIERFIGTRYHANDPYRELIRRQTVKVRTHPGTEDGTPEGRPVLLTPADMADKRRKMGPYIFSSQILQNPVADEAQNFKVEWLRYHRKRPDPKTTNNYILLDAASSKKRGSDYTAGWVVGLGRDRNVVIHDMVRDRLNLSQRAELVFRWHRKYPRIKQVRYEEYGLQSDIEHLQSKMEDEGYRFAITKVGGSVGKIDRIKRLIPWFEQGRIWLPQTLHYTDYSKRTIDLVQVFVEEEYKAFPVPVHDDMLDSLARLAEPDLPLVWPKEEPKPSDDDDTDHPDTTEEWMAA